MNKPESTYKKELFKWCQYFHSISWNEETQSYKSSKEQFLFETVTELEKTKVITVKLQLPKCDYIVQYTCEISNYNVEEFKGDLIEYWKEKLWNEVYREIILKGLQHLKNSNKQHA